MRIKVTVIEERRCASCDDVMGHRFRMVELVGEDARVCLCEACAGRLLNRKGEHQVEDHRAG